MHASFQEDGGVIVSEGTHKELLPSNILRVSRVGAVIGLGPRRTAIVKGPTRKSMLGCRRDRTP